MHDIFTFFHNNQINIFFLIQLILFFKIGLLDLLREIRYNIEKIDINNRKNILLTKTYMEYNPKHNEYTVRGFYLSIYMIAFTVPIFYFVKVLLI